MIIMMTKKKNWFRGIAVALAIMVAAPAVPAMPAQAATKKLTVTVKSPKKGAKLAGTKLAVHGKKTVQLTVKSGKSNVTAKATYKTNNKKVASVNKRGVVTVKGKGRATITVKYKGMVKKFSLTSAGHTWKAHKKTVTVEVPGFECVCGAIIPKEKKYCQTCVDNNYMCVKQGYCCCKKVEHSYNHIINGEESNYWYVDVKQKVTYVDYYQCSCGERKAGEPKPEY